MPKLAVNGKFQPSTLDGFVTKWGGNALRASTLWDANRVISADEWTIKALEQLYAQDGALDDPMIDRFGSRVLSVDYAALLADPLAYYPLNEPSGTPVNLGTATLTPALLGGQTQGANAGFLAAEPSRTNYVWGVAPQTLQGVQFDASASTTLAAAGTASHSVSAWIRQSSLDTTRYIAARYDSTGSNGWRFSTSSAGQLGYGRALAGVGSNATSASGVLVPNTLYHVGFAYDGTLNRSRLFVNGVLVKTTIHTTVPSLPAPSLQTRTALSGGNTWNGELGAVAIYDKALPDWHFRAQWAAGVYGPA